MYEIVVCSSSGGGNFESILKNEDKIGYKVTLLIVDRECGAIEKAVKYKIPFKVIDFAVSNMDKSDELDRLLPLETNLIVLAGYMPIISNKICEKWKGKLINTHPSLLPNYGGLGMYGVKVQEAVMAAKEIYAGCSVHYVSGSVDMGEVIRQKSIKINYEETPWELGGHIHKLERDLLIEVISILKSKTISRD